MVTTTSYGSWNNHGDRTNSTVGATIIDAINGGDDEWRRRMYSSGALGRIETAYARAINDALPDGVSLHGSEFIGPYHPENPEWGDEGPRIAAVVEEIDLFKLVERFDVDNIPEITKADLRELEASEYSDAVLYLRVGPDDDGDVTQMSLEVWSAACVAHEKTVITRQELIEIMGEDEDIAPAVANLPEWQETVTRLAVQAQELG